MKAVVRAFVLAALLIALVVTTALAGGDQVRGENGQGTVNQVQDPPPFQP
ncbi:MAG: hypothetical protein V1772_06245 [Chloroflexota bacterium]